MIVLLAYVAIFFIALALQHIAQERSFARQRAEWFEERRELLNRVQRPDILPATVSAPLELPERTEEQIAQERAWAQVGQVISIDPSYGLD